MDFSTYQLCGVYKVKGTNPGQDSGGYEGELEIAQNGEGLTVRWVVGPYAQVLLGTGLVSGRTLSVAFNYLDPFHGACTGLVVYDIVKVGKLQGRWIGFGGQGIGTEVCELVSQPPALH